MGTFSDWILVGAGVALIVIGFLGRSGRLPRNSFFGIRLPSTLRSDETWKAAHRAAWPYTFVTGVVMVGIGVLSAENADFQPDPWITLALIVGPTVLGAIRAHYAARAVGRGP